MEDLLQDITIYHKENNKWNRYNIKASLRNTSYLNRNTTGLNTSDNALIRIFNVKEYNLSYKVSKGDVIVSRNSDYEIEKAPLTELRNIYGQGNVYEVSSVEEFIFDNKDVKELNHIKVGAR
jgi:hypothetical protein